MSTAEFLIAMELALYGAAFLCLLLAYRPARKGDK